MPASYLLKHRPICDVLNQIRTLAYAKNDLEIAHLCDEAITYAQRMSSKLVEYKDQFNGR